MQAQSTRELTRAELALLKVLGFEWSDEFGCWLDTRGMAFTRWDTEADALDEACATVELADVEASNHGEETRIVLRDSAGGSP